MNCRIIFLACNEVSNNVFLMLHFLSYRIWPNTHAGLLRNFHGLSGKTIRVPYVFIGTYFSKLSELPKMTTCSCPSVQHDIYNHYEQITVYKLVSCELPGLCVYQKRIIFNYLCIYTTPNALIVQVHKKNLKSVMKHGILKSKHVDAAVSPISTPFDVLNINMIQSRPVIPRIVKS